MVSIIANFYNSGKYIPKLMESVAAQTYSDWELVCVDDCSPSNDSEVIRATAKSLGIEHKTRVIRNETNLGIAKAKKAGIDAAKGEYCTFIDGDDWFAREAIERMVRPMIEHGLDLVIMNHYRYYTPFYKQEFRSNVQPSHWNIPLQKEDFIKHYLVNFFAENIYGVAYWAKMYRTEMLRSLDFEYPDAKHSVREDFLFNMAVAEAATKVMFVDYAGYYWRYGGITTGKRDNADWGIYKYVLQNADMYAQRKALAQKYDFAAGIVPLLAQLKNLLIWSISRTARYDSSDSRSDAAKGFIREAVMHPAYSDICLLLDHNPTPENKRIIDALILKDTDMLYEICHQNYRRQWRIRLLNRTKHLLISPFLR